MNKLMMTFVSLLIAVPAVAMKKEVELVVITEKEHNAFVSRLSKEVKLSNKLFEEGKINDKNPIRIALNQLTKEMVTHGNNFGKILQSNEVMGESVYNFKKNSNKQFIKDISDAIVTCSGDVEMARMYQIKARHILSDIMFKRNFSGYVPQRINGIDVDDQNSIEVFLKNKHPEFITMICTTTCEDTIDYLVKNNNSHVEVDLKHHQGLSNIRCYMALLVYKVLFAYLD